MKLNFIITFCFLAVLGLSKARSQVTISSFTPNSGSIGSVVSISGTNFSLIPAENVVTFNGVQATVITSSNSNILANVPLGATSGKIAVSVSCKRAVSLSNFRPIVELRNTISSNTVLTNSTQYVLKGIVFVAKDATLSIQPGTTIFADVSIASMLIILPGGKIEANGTELDPIVFTSNSPIGSRNNGDWAGVHILGNAFVNQPTKPFLEGENFLPQFGTTIAEGSNPSTNSSENSGTLRYVRIEYGGRPLSPINSTNGLTLAGVGSGTTIEYVRVSNCEDDGFQFNGGTVNAKHLISFSNEDDDFDTDFGWGGNVQFALAIRNPLEAGPSGSNSFESDNQSTGDPIAGLCDGINNLGCTRGVFSNVSVFGPREVQTRSISSNYRNSIHFRRRSSISVFNSFFAGFRTGFRVDDQPSLDNLTTFSSSKFAHNVLLVPGTIVIGSSINPTDASFATNLSNGDATSIYNYWSASNGVINNIISNQAYDDLGINPALFWGNQSNYSLNPDFTLRSGGMSSNNLNSGSDFSDPKLTNAFFVSTIYRGAFGSSDWTDNWSNFNPQNTSYQPKFTPAPVILSFSPNSATSGSVVTITGSNFTSATAVNFGGISSNSFTIVSESLITATVGSGASGDISVATPTGTSTLCGFSYKLDQTISFIPPPDKTVGDPPFTLGATSTSSLPISFSTTSTKITLAGSQVTIVSAGRVSITANQTGNANYNSATPVTKDFCIKPAKSSITVSLASGTATLTSNAASGNQWYLNSVAIPSATSSTYTATAAGTYKVRITIDDCVGDFSNDTPVVITGDLPTGKPSMALYPNPTRGNLFIAGLESETNECSIVDLLGRPTMMNLEKTGDLHRLTTESLVDGVYMLRVNQSNSVHQLKFVKKN